MTVRNTAGGRQNQIQFLRFLAFLHVFGLHVESWCFIDYPLWNGGLSAVTFFFMLSGMLTGYSAYGRDIQVNLRVIGKDMWKRIRRMYPLYFLTTVFLTYRVNMLGELVYGGDRFRDDFIQLVKNLLLLQSWFPDGFFSFNGVGWYLSTLLFLNLFNLPMVFLLNKIGQKKRCNEVFFITIVLLLSLTVAYSLMTYNDLVHFLQYIFPPARLGQYFVAMIIGYMIRTAQEKNTLPNGSTAFFSILEAGALLFWVVTLFLETERWSSRLVFWVLPNIILIGVFMIGRGCVSTLFKAKPLVLLGDISFECYLIHPVIITMWQHVDKDTIASEIICVACVLTYTILTSLFINKKHPM